MASFFTRRILEGEVPYMVLTDLVQSALIGEDSNMPIVACAA